MAKNSEHPKSAPVVWLLTDNKAGHRNQLKGLGNRLRVLTGASLHWLDATEFQLPLWRAFVGKAPRLDNDLPSPDLIIAAGTQTHRLLLSLRRFSRARTLVLMKPGFPLSWVDGIIAPAHDAIAGKRIFVSEGALNAITPLARVTEKPEALILVGGTSSHFKWDDDALLEQITTLMRQYPSWRWTISGSRRTPAGLQTRLRELEGLKATVIEPDTTHENWLSHQLAASSAVWVTPDSLSMVCEAVTSGVPTGIFELEAHPGSRVAHGISRLNEQGRLCRWSDHAAVMAEDRIEKPPLWESDRAARWVIDRLLPAFDPAKRIDEGKKT